MFCVMKDAEYIQPNYWIDPRELLYRATLGGAARGLDGRCRGLTRSGQRG